MIEPTSPWIGVSFRHASPHVARDSVVSYFTNGPFVHTELILADGKGGVRAYAARDNTTGFSPSDSFSLAHGAQKIWTTVRYPLHSLQAYKHVYSIVLQIISLALPYNSQDLWQCWMQLALPFEHDLDCQKPETWVKDGVFCSQVVLLILRRLRREGILPLISHAIQKVNSRGCSPNQLFRLLVCDRPVIAYTQKTAWKKKKNETVWATLHR